MGSAPITSCVQGRRSPKWASGPKIARCSSDVATSTSLSAHFLRYQKCAGFLAETYFSNLATCSGLEPRRCKHRHPEHLLISGNFTFCFQWSPTLFGVHSRPFTYISELTPSVLSFVRRYKLALPQRFELWTLRLTTERSNRWAKEASNFVIFPPLKWLTCSFAPVRHDMPSIDNPVPLSKKLIEA